MSGTRRVDSWTGERGDVRLRGRTGCQKVDGERVWQREGRMRRGGTGERYAHGGWFSSAEI